MLNVFIANLNSPNLLSDFNKWKESTTYFKQLFRDAYIDLSDSYDNIGIIRSEVDGLPYFSFYLEGFIVDDEYKHSVSFYLSRNALAEYINTLDETQEIIVNPIEASDKSNTSSVSSNTPLDDSDNLLDVIAKLRQENALLRQDNDFLKRKLQYLEDDGR
jgi:hypothetical protein